MAPGSQAPLSPSPSLRVSASPRLISPGFTLLEALLALFIFSTAVISLVEAINQTGRTVLISRRERQVQTRLETYLCEATRSPEFLAKLRNGENVETTVTEGDVSYKLTTKPLELSNVDGQELNEMFAVNVTAQWKEGRESQEISAETWVFPPLFATGPQ
jgi:competence protein ComGC